MKYREIDEKKLQRMGKAGQLGQADREREERKEKRIHLVDSREISAGECLMFF